MRLLANENIPREVVEALRKHGHDVTWVRTDCPGTSDREVLSLAQSENRILLTFDKDFGELAFRTGLSASSGVVLFRVPPKSPGFVAHIAVVALQTSLDWAGHFSVVEERWIRMTPLPDQPRK
jgi:predicted nuclease of predicted toxin-antitoxin system